jgi:hypothetical protein
MDTLLSVDDLLIWGKGEYRTESIKRCCEGT